MDHKKPMGDIHGKKGVITTVSRLSLFLIDAPSF